jgi:glutathione S-transferase
VNYVSFDAFTIQSLGSVQGLDYAKEYIDFANKPDWLFEKNKAGTVPLLQDGDKWVADSGDICKYLDEAYGNPLGEGQIPGVAEKLFPSFVQFLKASDEDVAEKEAALLAQLKELNSYLEENGPYLAGKSMGAPDAMIVRAALHTFKYKSFFKLPDALSYLLP